MSGSSEQSSKRNIRRERIHRLLPNALTMLGLCAGLTSIRFGLEERWEIAIFLIAGAALLDTLDGRIARLVGGSSDFGGQLDSLVDSIAFGVAPVIVMFLWSLQTAAGLGWAIALLFPICCVLRLARFNVSSAENSLPTWSNRFFTGIPAPAGAGLLLLPLMVFAETSWDWLRSPWLVGPWTLLIGALMISRLPTWSFKNIKIRTKYFRASMAAIAFLAAAMFTEPLWTLAGIIITYGCTLPLSMRAYKHLQIEENAKSFETTPSQLRDDI